MIEPGSLLWFARHELRLSWRDVVSMMTAGRKGRERQAAIGAAVFVGFLHFVAWLVLGHAGSAALANDLPTRIAITCGILLSGSAMLSQAMESVTRTFYTRSDLELILSSPARVHRLFAVRLGALALSVGAMALFLIGPFIDVLAFEGGLRWLGAYGVLIAVSSVAAALGAVFTVLLFQTIGPRRTRLAAQIGAALIGGGFVIGLQMAAMFSTGTISRVAFLHSRFVLTHVPGLQSIVWWPARAALGEPLPLLAVFAAGLGLLLITIWFVAPRFASYALAASSTAQQQNKRIRARPFRAQGAGASLRRKELLLLLRDPWLISQSLMQMLYLLPPAVLLWRSFALGDRAAIVIVPVLIMAAGQLAGGLAWLTISGEDAPDLVLTAPLAPQQLLRAKVEAVMAFIAVVFAPFVFALVFVSPAISLIAAGGIAASAMSATAIQLWFRAQAKRSQFRRRHTSSRIATFSEAFTSISWSAAGAVAAAGSWLAGIVALLALGILATVRAFSPARAKPA